MSVIITSIFTCQDRTCFVIQFHQSSALSLAHPSTHNRTAGGKPARERKREIRPIGLVILDDLWN